MTLLLRPSPPTRPDKYLCISTRQGIFVSQLLITAAGLDHVQPSLTKGCGQTERHQMRDVLEIKNHQLLDAWAEVSEIKNTFSPRSFYISPQYIALISTTAILKLSNDSSWGGGRVFATYSACKMDVHILYHLP